MTLQTTDKINKANKEHVQKFHVAHSSALMAWQQVEDNMFLIFSELLDSKTQDADSAIFYSANLYAKVKMIDSLFKVSPTSGKIGNRWQELRDEINARKLNRNSLAHCDTHFNLNRKNSASLTLGKSKFDVLSPNLKVGVKDMEDWGNLFVNLAASLNLLLTEIQATHT